MSDRVATFTEVQATLLNSEDDPRTEVVEALRAIVRFAREELDAADGDLFRFFDRAIEEEDDAMQNADACACAAEPAP